VRFACLFSGNGFHTKEWWAKGGRRQDGAREGTGAVPSVPREDAVSCAGLYNQEALNWGHSQLSDRQPALRRPILPAAAKSTLERAWIRPSPNALKDQTKVPSLVLGCEPSIAALHKNYSMIYSSHISWSSPSTPTPLELYPALAFDRLFRDEVGPRRQERAWDAVGEDAQGFAQIASASPTSAGLDEYLASVRDGRRADRSGGQGSPLARLAADARQARHAAPPPTASRRTSTQHMRLMSDILVLAFRTDTTRVLHAEVEQRSLVAALPAFERWTT